MSVIEKDSAVTTVLSIKCDILSTNFSLNLYLLQEVTFVELGFEKHYIHTVGDKKNGILALFRSKMGFLKWTWRPIQ